MAYEMRENTGTLFKNEDKDEDTHADYQGEALVGGTLYWFNAWIKTGKSGKKFMSCSFRPKQQRNAPPKERPAQNQDVADMDNDIPFADPYRGIRSLVV